MATTLRGVPPSTSTEQIDINTASVEELDKLPGTAPGAGLGRCGAVQLSVAVYESPRTTRLYDRTSDAIRHEAISDDGLSLNEIERILI